LLLIAVAVVFVLLGFVHAWLLLFVLLFQDCFYIMNKKK